MPIFPPAKRSAGIQGSGADASNSDAFALARPEPKSARLTVSAVAPFCSGQAVPLATVANSDAT